MSSFRSQQARAESSDELIHKHELTVEEVAELFRFPADIVRHAVWAGELPARLSGDEICGIARTDLVIWLKARSEREGAAPNEPEGLARRGIGAQ